MQSNDSRICSCRPDPARSRVPRIRRSIVTGRSSDVRPSLGRDFPIPVVYALATSADPLDVSITHDDTGGASLAVRHLLATGRRKIAMVSGPAHHTSSQNRVRGTLQALVEAGEQLVGGVPLYGDWSERWGREAAIRLLRSGAEFSGVFCASDQIARGVADGLRENDISVPHLVGVVGVDNWDVMVDASRPTLTTVDLNLGELGHVAATRLLALIDKEHVAPGVEKISCHLVPRQSTAVD